MGNNAAKRQRQRENRPDVRPPNSRQRALVTVGVLAALLVVGIVIWLLGGSDDPADDSAAETTATTEPPAEQQPTPCPPAEGVTERVQTFTGAPENCIDPATTSYSATFVTTEGTFTAELDAAAAPQTVNNFVVLSRYRYYDGVPIHRIVPDFVIQGGDGDGEPLGSNELGYTIADELPDSSEAYTDYSLAMANAGPNTNGSQFFVVLPGGGSRLSPTFSRFGEVTEGREVVDAIGALGSPSEEPTKEILIETVEITETPL